MVLVVVIDGRSILGATSDLQGSWEKDELADRVETAVEVDFRHDL